MGKCNAGAYEPLSIQYKLAYNVVFYYWLLLIGKKRCCHLLVVALIVTHANSFAPLLRINQYYRHHLWSDGHDRHWDYCFPSSSWHIFLRRPTRSHQER